MQEMAMLSQAHKCFKSSFFQSSYCTRARLRSWRKELGFATPQQQSIGLRRTCGRLLVTGTDSSMGLGCSYGFHLQCRVHDENGFVVFEFRTNVWVEVESNSVTEVEFFISDVGEAQFSDSASLRGRYSKSTLKLGSEPSSAEVYRTLGLKGRNPILGGVPPPASEGKRTWGEVAQNDQQQRMLQVVLVSPQIPGNTGCIARTCAATCVGLHLVEPMGFKIEDSKLKRAGLDYWPYVVVKVHKSWNDFFTYFQEQAGEKRLLAFTKKGRDVHTDVNYKSGDWLLFGSEVDGLPAAALEQCSSGEYAGGTVRLPMNETYVRSLNLSVSAGIGVYEALRQLDSHTNYSTLDVQASSPPLEAVLSGHNDGYP